MKTLRESIIQKFGGDFVADERTFVMGIDIRFTTHFAERLRNRVVLEACTGAGFSTMALPRTARHVFTVELDPVCQAQASANLRRSGLSERVTLVQGDVMEVELLEVNAAFLDPDWPVTSVPPSTGLSYTRT